MPNDVATVRSRKLLAYLELEDIGLILRKRWLNWLSHVEHSSGAFRTACAIQVDGRRGFEAVCATVDPQEIRFIVHVTK